MEKQLSSNEMEGPEGAGGEAGGRGRIRGGSGSGARSGEDMVAYLARMNGILAEVQRAHGDLLLARRAPGPPAPAPGSSPPSASSPAPAPAPRHGRGVRGAPGGHHGVKTPSRPRPGTSPAARAGGAGPAAAAAGARGGAAPARRRPALKPWGSPADAKAAGARGERERKRSPLGKGTAAAAARRAPGASPPSGRPLPDDDLEEKFGSFLANLRTQRAELVAISESPAKPPAPAAVPAPATPRGPEPPPPPAAGPDPAGVRPLTAAGPRPARGAGGPARPQSAHVLGRARGPKGGPGRAEALHRLRERRAATQQSLRLSRADAAARAGPPGGPPAAVGRASRGGWVREEEREERGGDDGEPPAAAVAEEAGAGASSSPKQTALERLSLKRSREKISRKNSPTSVTTTDPVLLPGGGDPPRGDPPEQEGAPPASRVEAVPKKPYLRRKSRMVRIPRRKPDFSHVRARTESRHADAARGAAADAVGRPTRGGLLAHDEEKEEKKAAARRGGDDTWHEGVAFSPLLAEWFRTSARSYAAMAIDCGSLFGGPAGGVPGLPADRDLLRSLADRAHGVPPGEVDPAMHQLHVLRYA